MSDGTVTRDIMNYSAH